MSCKIARSSNRSELETASLQRCPPDRTAVRVGADARNARVYPVTVHADLRFIADVESVDRQTGLRLCRATCTVCYPGMAQAHAA